MLKEEMENTEPPTLADVIHNILHRREQTGQPSRYGGINNLKAAASILNFLTANNIMDMAGLDEKLKSMIGKQFAIRDELKPIERRLKTLDEHIDQAEKYREYRPFKQKYNQQKPKNQEQYYESYRRELTLYDAAERYIKAHLNGRDKIPLPTWQAEREKLTAEKNRLNREYVSLKNDTAAVEKSVVMFMTLSARKGAEHSHSGRRIWSGKGQGGGMDFNYAAAMFCAFGNIGGKDSADNLSTYAQAEF